MNDCVKCAVNRAAAVRRVAEVLLERLLLVFGDVNRVLDKLVNALVFGCRYGNHGNPEHGLHCVDVHRAAVARHFIHHIERHHHRHVGFKQLHCQVQIALNVGCVHNIDDTVRLFVQHEVAGDKFLARVGRHGINTRQVGDQGVVMPSDDTVLAVDCYAGKVADVLVRSCELIEERRLTAVLIADQGECQRCAGRQGIAAALGVEFAFFTETWVLYSFFLLGGRLRLSAGNKRLNIDFIRVVQPKRQLVTMNPKLYRIPHRCEFDHCHFCPGDYAHIQKMLAQRARAAYLFDDAGFPRL